MPIENFNSFNLQLGRFENNELPNATKTFQQKIALDVLRGVVFKTPVDTGRARGNWQVTTGTPAEGVAENLDTNGASTVSQGSQVITQIDSFGVIWISNNVPYIEVLENGTPTRPPHGMVRRTLAEVEALGTTP